jgi:hypothetical protein
MTVHTRRSSGRGLGNAGVDDTVATAQITPGRRAGWRRRTRCPIGNGCRLFGFFTPDKKRCATPAEP